MIPLARDDIAIIKKYANRRLYNTQTSIYVTLEDLYKMVVNNEHFKVVDAKSGQDLTQSTLAQIIFDEEARGGGMLPVNFMWNIIRMYDDNLKTVVPHYLEMSMDHFMQNQQNVVSQMQKMMMGGQVPNQFDFANPFKGWEDIGRKNMESMQEAMKSMNPFYTMMEKMSDSVKTEADNANVEDLKKQIEALNKENLVLKEQLKKASE